MTITDSRLQWLSHPDYAQSELGQIAAELLNARGHIGELKQKLLEEIDMFNGAVVDLNLCRTQVAALTQRAEEADRRERIAQDRVEELIARLAVFENPQEPSDEENLGYLGHARGGDGGISVTARGVHD